MKTTRRAARNAAISLCGLMLAAAGCTTYVAQPPPRTVYVVAPPPPPPPPAPAYVPPPAPAIVVPPAPVEPAAPVPPEAVAIREPGDFYQPLSAYGQWVAVGSYGRCWRPTAVAVGWRPYTDGHWERTDAGWYWVSDEPWGWATYHYGRWDWTAQFGWVWVPQTQWAPAWVVWREGDGYVGWAPMPPSVTLRVGGGVELHAAFAARAFVFVHERHFLEPVRPAAVVVNNTTIINRTVNITNIRVVQRTVVNEGPRLRVIERTTGRQIRPLAVHELRQREERLEVTRQRERRGRFQTRAPAPVRVEREVQKNPPPRQPARPEARPEMSRAAKPAAPELRLREVKAQERPAVPARRGTEPPARAVGKKAENVPVAARPAAKPEPRKFVPPRNERPVERRNETNHVLKKPEPSRPRAAGRTGEVRAPKPLVRREAPKAAGPEMRPASKPPRERHAAVAKPVARPNGKAAERQAKPANRKPSAREPVRKNGKKDERQKPGQPEAPADKAVNPPGAQ